MNEYSTSPEAREFFEASLAQLKPSERTLVLALSGLESAQLVLRAQAGPEVRDSIMGNLIPLLSCFAAVHELDLEKSIQTMIRLHMGLRVFHAEGDPARQRRAAKQADELLARLSKGDQP